MERYVLSKVCKLFGEVEALSPSSLSIDAGEKVALVGPSGSGKSTLLLLLSGILQPTSGTIELNGQYLHKLKPGKELSQLVGMVHQQLDLVPQLSAKHNVLAGRLGNWSFFRSCLSILIPQELETAKSALKLMGIESKINTRTSRLSGGEQQRVAFARVFVQNPHVILADEPVSSLDPPRAQAVVKLLCSTTNRYQKTLVASLHSIDLAKKYFDRIIGLRAGKIMFDIPASELKDDTLETLYELDEEIRSLDP